MPETNVRTNLDIKANARAIDTLTAKFRELFSGRTTREFNTEIGKTNRALDEQKRRIGDIATAMSKVRRESDVYKTMEADLKNATKQATLLQRALETVSRATVGRGGGGGGGGVARGPGGGSGGFGTRMGGMQLAMPGQGAMMAALGSIPIAGGIAAGSLAAATQTYGSFVQLQQARMQATPYLQTSRNLMNYRRQQLEAGSQGGIVGGTSPEQTRRNLGIQAGAETLASMFEGPEGLAGGAMRERIQGRIRTTFSASQARLERGEGTLLDQARETFGSGVVALGETFAPTATAAAAGRVSGGQVVPGRAARFNQPVDFGQYERAGIPYGLAPQAGIQQAGEFGAAAGFAPDVGTFTAGLAMERVFGIGMQQTGQMARGLQQTGTRAENTAQSIADALAGGVMEGLNGSSLAEELQKQTGFLEEQSRRGVEINFDQLRMQRGLLSGLRGAGGEQIRPELIGDIGRGFARRAGQMGQEAGGDEAMQARLYRAYAEQRGIAGEPVTGERWSQFMLDIQNPETAQGLMPGMARQFQGIGRGPAENQLFMQRMMRSMGVDLGPGNALSAFTTGEFGQAGGGRADLGGIREAGRGVVPGTLAVEAGLEAQRAGVGAEIAGTVQNFSRIQNDMARAAGAFQAPLERVTGQMHLFADGLARSIEIFMAGGMIEGPTETR